MEELTICWSITTMCNMKCSYCFSSYDNDNKQFHMNDRLVDVTLNKLKEASKKYSIRLVILGGEPTLHPRLKEICESCLTFCRKVIVVTNGTNVDVVETLPENIYIDVSYHGQKLSYFIPLVQRLQNKHFTQILCVLDKSCETDIINLHSWCEEHNFMFEAIPCVDNVTEISETYDDTFLDKVSTNILYQIPMFDGLQSNIDVYRKNKANIEENTFFYCKQSNIAIYATGYYYPCCKSGFVNHKYHIEDDNHNIRIGSLCKHRYCMENRGCLDFAGWRQDPDGFLFGNNE